MLQTIESMNLPHDYVAIYEFQGTWNRCVNTFEEVGDEVLYTMETEFRFPSEMPAPKEVFKSSTQAEMERFKVFVENYKK